MLRTIRESEAFAQGSKLLQSAREEVQQIDVKEYASKAGAVFRSVNWKLIGFIALSTWLLLVWDPILTFFPACCLLLIAWRRGYTWASMLLLASVLLGLVRLSRVVWSDAGQGDLATTFFHSAWYLPFVSLGLNILAVLLFFLDHAGKLKSRPRFAWAMTLSVVLLLAILALPMYATYREASRRHTLTPTEQAQASELFQAYESRKWYFVKLGEPFNTDDDLIILGPAITSDRYGGILYEHEISINGTLARASFRLDHNNIRIPTPVVYQLQNNEQMLLDYASPDSISLRHSRPGSTDELYVALPLDLMEKRNRESQERSTALFNENLSRFNAVVDSFQATFQGYACGNFCFASFRELEGAGLLRELLCPDPDISGYHLTMQFEGGPRANPDLIGDRFLVRTRRTLLEIQPGGSPENWRQAEELVALGPIVSPNMSPTVPKPGPAPSKPRSNPDQSVFQYGDERLDRDPEYPGGKAAMLEFIDERLVYPEEERAAGKVATVGVRVRIEPTGRIVTTDVVASRGEAFDNEAIRVINEMPDWEPGVMNGKAVTVSHVIRVKFSIH